MLIAVMMSVLLISREVDGKTVYTILAKPVKRWQFLLGKYFGLLATVVINLALMSAMLVLMVRIYTGETDLGLVFASAMIALEMAVVAAFATLFSVTTRPMLGTVFTLAVYIIGHVSEDIWTLTQNVTVGFTRPVVAAVYYVLPNLERFNFKTEIVHGLQIPWAAVAWATVYGVAYAALVLLLATWRFQRKDLV
jgi:ABC-type transport system involved in multi-copper enzyme maturation permease subunit